MHWYIGSAVLLVLTAVNVDAAPLKDSGCTDKAQRKAWHTLSNKEKHAYIDAELCLMHKDAEFDLPGTRTRFDELQACHVMQAEITHGVGAFLPFHRLLVFAHEQLLKKECGYDGAQPYWDEPRDAGDFGSSDILDPDHGFGGDGTGNKHCIEDGPFVDYVNGIGPGHAIRDHCIDRQIDEEQSALASQDQVDRCWDLDDFSEAWPCIENAPHIAGHGGMGRQMSDAISSPGDPIFYLHHAYLDKVWWGWQQRDLPHRLHDMGGRNGQDPCIGFPEDEWQEDPPDGDFSSGPSDCHSARHKQQQRIAGDPGSTTTLNHVLDMFGLIPNATIRDVMDIGGDLLCYEYDSD